MNSYEHALELFHNHRFEDAIVCLERIISEKNLEADTLEKGYQLLLKNYEVIKNPTKEYEARFAYGKFLLEQKKYVVASNVFHSLLAAKRNGVVFRGAWECAIQNGEIEKARSLSHEYLNYLLEHKNVKEGLDFVSHAESKGIEKEILNIYRIRLLILQNDISKLSQALEKIANTTLNKEVFENIDEDIIHNIPSWRVVEIICQFRIQQRINAWKAQKFQNLSMQKEIINLLYDYIINFPRSTFGYFRLAEYGEYAKRKNILISIRNFHKVNLDLFKKDKKDTERMLKGIMIADSLPGLEDEEFHEETSLDLGKDLFTSAASRNRVQKIVQDINYLIRIQEKGNIEDLYNELERLDPANLLLKKRSENKLESTSQSNDESAGLFEKEFMPNFEEILDSSSSESEAFKIEEKLVVSFGILTDEQLKETYQDTIVALLMMEMPKAALKLIEVVEEKKLITEEWGLKLKLEYLKIFALINAREYHAALGCIEKVLKTWPVSNEESLSFLYFSGEIYRKQGHMRAAEKAYEKVVKINHRYRLVQQRLKEIGEKIKN